jgi:hypothetical protein
MVWKGRNIFTGKSWRLCSGILIFACALTLATCSAHAAAKTFLANDYGAKGDGSTLNTVSIQKTIDAAANSGGTVTFKPGTYLTGSLFMKSGTRLDVGEGLILIGSQKLDDYPMLPTRIAGIEMAWPSALINVRGQHDVTIGGKGTIDGDGPIWWKSYWDLRATYEPKGLRWASDYDARRPRLILLQNSSDIHLGDGILLKRSGFLDGSSALLRPCGRRTANFFTTPRACFTPASGGCPWKAVKPPRFWTAYLNTRIWLLRTPVCISCPHEEPPAALPSSF